MKKAKKILVSALILFGIWACEKNTNTPSYQSHDQMASDSSEIKEEATVMIDVKDLAHAIALSLENNSLKSLIKSNVMKKFDGDFDILLKDLAIQHLEDGTNVEEILNNQLAEKGKTVQSLYSKYSKLQISIPVNCEEWRPEEYTPLVAYYNVLTDDESITSINAFNSKGECFEIPVKEQYSLPIIVVDFNERIDYNENFSKQPKASNIAKPVESSIASAGYSLVVQKVYLYDNHEPWYKGAAEIIGRCRVNPSCTIQTFAMPSVDWEDQWYTGSWTVFQQTACDDISDNWLWSWIGLEIWEDDDFEDDAVDWHFKTPLNDYILTFGMLAYPQEFTGRGWTNPHAKIIAASVYN